MLGKAGIDVQGNLSVFLSTASTPKLELAKMLSKEHTWIGLLKDTVTECALVAFADSCLEFKYRGGVLCGGAGHSGECDSQELDHKTSIHNAAWSNKIL